jgi:hypothetical protein
LERLSKTVKDPRITWAMAKSCIGNSSSKVRCVITWSKLFFMKCVCGGEGVLQEPLSHNCHILFWYVCQCSTVEKGFQKCDRGAETKWNSSGISKALLEGVKIRYNSPGVSNFQPYFPKIHFNIISPHLCLRIPNSLYISVLQLKLWMYFSYKSRDSSVGIALDDRGSRVRFPAGVGNFSLHHRVQNDSGAHPASHYSGYQWLFPWVWSDRGVKLTTHLHLVPR